MSTATKRSLRVAELIWRDLAQLLSRYTREPVLNTVMITHVKVSDDLSNAVVFFTLLDKQTLASIEKLLHRETKRMRGLLSKSIKLRYVPRIKFVYDSFIDKKEKLLTLINSLPADREE